MRHLRDFGLIISLALWYFVSIYFAVAALYLPWALAAGLLAGMLAMVIFFFLVLIAPNRETEFLVVWLAIIPTGCIAAGIIWWILRVLDLFVIR